MCSHHGRVKSRSLTTKQKALMNSLLPDITYNNGCIQDETFLEIGFGSGDHIASLALQNIDSLYIGCEPFINGVASLLVKITDNCINNVRIFPDDVRKLQIQENSINGVFLLFPDPWPKRKHFGRRFVNERNLKMIHKAMKDGAFWRVATDHVDYANCIIRTFEKHGDLFELGSIYSNGNRPAENEWPKTRYENKSKSEQILYVEYIKPFKHITHVT